MSDQPDPQRSAAIQAQAATWWTRLDSGTAEASEYQAFEDWLKQDPAHRAAFDKLSALWGELDALKPRFAQPPPQPQPAQKPVNRRRFEWKALATAAALVLFWFSPWGLWLRADYFNPVGETREFSLSDGSTVYLNSNSAVSIHFGGESRQIDLLQGEAWFKVHTDPQRPFRVHARNGTVTALGTAFNIRLAEAGTEVTVTEHRVAVNLDKGGQPAMLDEGRRLTYGTELHPAENADVTAATAWQRGKLVFRNQPLGDVIAELNRYHHGEILITDQTLAQRRVNGVFKTSQPLAAVDALKTSLNVHSLQLGDWLILLYP